MRVHGLVPHIPAARPRAPAVWWCAAGVVEDGALRIERLEERDRAVSVTAPCGIAAPCSLPGEFLEWAGGDVSSWTRGRLLDAARAFAARRPHGRRHPLREGDTVSPLDRTRLVRFHAALPLLATARDALVEVDVPALLRRHDLPATGLSGSRARAIARRAAILRELDIAVAERDYAIASWPALEAVLCCYGVIR